MIEVGTICIKTRGRENGKYAVVVKKLNNSFVMVTGPRGLTGVRRRKANILHLKETGEKLEIKEDASDEEVMKAWEKSGLIKKFNLKKPTVVKSKESKKKEEKKTIKKDKKKSKKKSK